MPKDLKSPTYPSLRKDGRTDPDTPGGGRDALVLHVMHLVTVGDVAVVPARAEIEHRFGTQNRLHTVDPETAIPGQEDVSGTHAQNRQTRAFLRAQNRIQRQPAPLTEERVGIGEKGFSTIESVFQSAMRNLEELGHRIDSPSRSPDPITDTDVFDRLERAIGHLNFGPCDEATRSYATTPSAGRSGGPTTAVARQRDRTVDGPRSIRTLEGHSRRIGDFRSRNT